MKTRGFFRLFAAAVMVAGGFAPRGTFASDNSPVIREPAVAGLFYPRDPKTLAGVIDSCLAAAKTERTGELKALICPHAGYEFSGLVAGSSFRLLRGATFNTVVLLAPSHYALLDSASVSKADLFRTPLGDVPISRRARELAKIRPFKLEPVCQVERPGWAAQSSRPIPREETADTWEHADEVEVPFLQKTLGRFELLPVVFGEVDPAAAARGLASLLDDHTLIVASSDLSHYHPYEEARTLDRDCVNAICALDVAKMSHEEACGRTPILTLMHIAKQRGWKPVLLDYRNSGDTAGDKSRVVGYAAIAFYGPASAPVAPAKATTYSPAEQEFLLKLARQTVREVVTNGELPAVAAESVDKALTEPKGCFVTLNKAGDLRGCIGHLAPVLPLYRAVMENARSAALRDPRFPPVTWREVDQLEIEISVLTEPQPIVFSSPEDLLAKLNPHVDGVILQYSGHTATYLPQVWEQLPDKTQFMDSLAEKAGLSARDWRKRGASVQIYHVESFKETSAMRKS